MKSIIYPAIVAVALTTSPLLANTLSVSVKGSSDLTGEIRVALFNDPQGFPDEASRFRGDTALTTERDEAGGVIIRFDNVAPGSYALAAYLDLNGNHRLDTNFLGFPKEPYAISNGIRARLGPPAFSDATFIVSDAERTVELVLE